MNIGPKTSIKQIPVANEKLYKLVAYKCDTSPKQVEECIDILSKFIRRKIEEGALEGVMIPYFGKIKVKDKRVQWLNHCRVMPHLPTHIQPKPLSEETRIALKQTL